MCSSRSSVGAHESAHAKAVCHDLDALEIRVLPVSHGTQLIRHPFRLGPTGGLQPKKPARRQHARGLAEDYLQAIGSRALAPIQRGPWLMATHLRLQRP